MKIEIEKYKKLEIIFFIWKIFALYSMKNYISFLKKKTVRKSMTIKKLFAFLFYFDKIDNFANELHGANDQSERKY